MHLLLKSVAWKLWNPEPSVNLKPDQIGLYGKKHVTLKEVGTWEVVDAPEDTNIVGSKWVFRAKKDAAGNVIRMFAPVAWLASIRTVLVLAAAEDYEMGQIDIKVAYLNGELTSNEVIFMRQLPGYEESKG